MKRRFLSRILVFILVLSLLPVGALADSAVSYADTGSHWAKAAIDKWSGLGIIQGAEGKFRPDDSITRGETAVILDRVMKYAAKSANSFTDLGQDFYTDAMLRANAAGIMKGDAGTIRPADKITREEAVVVLGRALGLTESTASTTFSDSAQISSWASGYVNTMVKLGYVQGASGAFNPKAAITRAEFVTILNNAIAKIYHEATTYTENVDGTVIVNVPGAVLKNMTVSGDLILSEGVGDGDVTLENVTVTGRTTIRGGGENSIHITGNSHLGDIFIEKRADGSIRIVTADGAVVDALYVDDGSDAIILTGDFKSVTIAEGVDVKAVDAEIKSVSMTGAATFDVDAKSTVGTLTATGTAAGASVTVEGKIGTLTAESKITVDNDGTITKAVVNADGVVVGGNKPSTVTVGSSVTEEPVDDEGDPLVTTPTGGGGGGGGSSTPSLSVSVVKLATVAQDTNHDDSAFNQAAVEVAKVGNAVTVSGDYVALKAFASTDVSQNAMPHKWVGLVVDTGLSSIVGVKYNDVALAQVDVAEAASVGVGAGKFVLWVKADELLTTPKTFTLAKTGYTTRTMTVSFVDSMALTGAVSVLATAPADDNATASQFNQDSVEVAQQGDAVTVTANTGALNSFTSTASGQGEHQWIGLVVATGQNDITKVKFNGQLMTTSDVADAESVGAPAGSFVLWLKADTAIASPVTFTLSQDGRASKTVTVSFVDTKPLTGTVTKLAKDAVANDDNELVSGANQDAVAVSQQGGAVTVTGTLGTMNAFESTVKAQGIHKWVGLVVDTNQASIIGIKYNGAALTADDAAEAASVNAPAGSFVLWIKADEVVLTPKTFTLSQMGRADKEITVTFVDATPLEGTVTKIAIPSSVTAQANQDSVAVGQTGNTVTITGNIGALNSFASATEAQGTHMWVGLAVATGQSTILGVSYDGAALTQADVAEATNFSVPAGSFVLWIKADEVVKTPKTFTLSQAGKADKTVTVNVVDTMPLTGAVTKIATVNQTDGNTFLSQQNQNAVQVVQIGNGVTVLGELGNLNVFQSTAPGHEEQKWIGLVVATGQPSIIGVMYNGAALTQADVDEAASVGAPAGSFVLWIKADAVAEIPKTFTLSQLGRADKTITVSFEDTTPTALASAGVVSGVKNTAITAKTITITLEHVTFTSMVDEIGSSLDNWFTNLPAGLTTKATKLMLQGDSLGVTISGTPTEVSSAAMEITIPGEKLSSGVALNVTVDPDTTYYSITDAPAGPQVAAVSNIHYEVVGRDVHLEFTRPADDTGISDYAVEFSTDGGDTWENNAYLVGVDSNNIVPMSDAACAITQTTTYNQVRVISLAAIGSGYTSNEVTADINFTFTVSGDAVGFGVLRNDDNDYTITLDDDATTSELYSIDVTKASNAPSYYPLSYTYYYDVSDPSSTVIPLAGGTEAPIADGSLFAMRKITSVSTTGLTVSANAAPESAEEPHD